MRNFGANHIMASNQAWSANLNSLCKWFDDEWKDSREEALLCRSLYAIRGSILPNGSGQRRTG